MKEAKVEIELHANQIPVWNDKHRFKVLVAGRKWWKTTFIINWLFSEAIKTDLVYPYIAPFRQQAKEIAWEDHVKRVCDMCKDQNIKYKTNASELSISFESGGKIVLLGVDNAEAHRGKSNWGRVGCDEYADWGVNIWPSIIRPNLIPHKAPAIIAGTPKGFDNLHDAYQKGIKGSKSYDPDYKSWHFTSYDNPQLDRRELASLAREYKKEGEDFFQQEIMAEFLKPVGTVYREWSMDKRFIDLEYDQHLPLHISWDFGINDPTSLIWFQPHGSEVRVVDYYEASEVNLEHFVQVIKAKPYKEVELHTGDPAGKARTLTTGTSPIEMLAKKGIHVRVKDGVKIPEQVRVTHGLIPRLYVKNTLERFRDCLVNYRYPEVSEEIRDQSNEIPMHDEYSHAMRALEYYAVNTEQEDNEELSMSPLA